MPNRLAKESSLYLRQHANNPVDWFPWGPEALTRARSENKPIFLSIGYSACHWCHVMEHESFENIAIARVLNDDFVCIKVDREERPDIDDIYMKAVQLMNQGHGGWPMSVWLTPEMQPIYAGTYFPPEDKYGRAGFRRILGVIAESWRTKHDEMKKAAEDITKHLNEFANFQMPEAALEPERLLRLAERTLNVNFDSVHGGFGAAPKFPHALELRLLLRTWQRFGDQASLDAVRISLDKMARGGMYDQIGGGFHRYSVDAQWLVPHFEKMLYDNSLLAGTYLDAFQATGDAFYRQIVEETLDYVLREMTSPKGAFYSTQDADSEGVEGKFYVWSQAEIDAALGQVLATFAWHVWGVTEAGNFEGHNILCRKNDDATDAKQLGMSVEEFREKINDAKRKLLEVRGRRVWPGRDEKILTSWNGLMIAAFARAGAVLERADYTKAAVAAAEFLVKHLGTADGRLYHTASADGEAKVNGFLEDYSYLAEGLTHLYEATLDARWLKEAEQLAEQMIRHFGDKEGAGFFTTADDHEKLLLRAKDQHDGSTPSGNAMAVTALLRLAVLTGRTEWRDLATKTMASFAGIMQAQPSATGQMLNALDLDFGPVQEVALAGDPKSAEFQEVSRAAWKPYAPRRIISHTTSADRPAKGSVTLYLCENSVCGEPISDPAKAVAAVSK